MRKITHEWREKAQRGRGRAAGAFLLTAAFSSYVFKAKGAKELGDVPRAQLQSIVFPPLLFLICY